MLLTQSCGNRGCRPAFNLQESITWSLLQPWHPVCIATEGRFVLVPKPDLSVPSEVLRTAAKRNMCDMGSCRAMTLLSAGFPLPISLRERAFLHGPSN